jgi:hypothetical protein
VGCRFKVADSGLHLFSFLLVIKSKLEGQRVRQVLFILPCVRHKQCMYVNQYGSSWFGSEGLKFKFTV